ncbi:unnamed protein product [Clonostachys rosea]|uniref:Major facilitator superfamily (MFS) profile domain-containing protein n=1 Tax=Bionectria ochroleuca TaxID=29856 RepID=A0ABY6V280_BIOOC|nr:unnamed protein product [Clonostachys rosea]
MESTEIKTPGTVRLIDLKRPSDGKHSSDVNATDIILIPTPTDDPEDPLNWSFRRKLLSTSCVVVYTVMVVLPSTTVYSVTTPISKSTSLSIDNLITGLGIMFLFAGWACIPWQAVALQYGKRPIYLVSSAGLVVVMALAPRCKTWGPYLANKILHGILTAPVESLCEISITDVWFAHERPRYLALYGFALAFAGKLAPTLAGFINDGQGWEWTLYWSGIWGGFAFLYCLFLMEETTYDRPKNNSRSTVNTSDTNTNDTEGIDSEKKVAEVKTTNQDVENGQVYSKKTYWQKLSVWPQRRPNRLLATMWAPLRFFSYPIVVYAGLMYGANGLVWSSILNSTAGTLYPRVYGFSTSGIALAYLGGVAGVIVGALYCGKLGEVLVIRLARRNNGISEPEHILWTFIASLTMVPFSLILWGLGGTYGIHWFGMVFAQFTLSISNAIACPMALAYAISSYPELSGELVTTAVIIRNTMSFAINYAITPWIKAQGFRDTFITAAAIGFVFNASMFVMIRYGKKLREMSAARYWKTVEESGGGH